MVAQPHHGEHGCNFFVLCDWLVETFRNVVDRSSILVNFVIKDTEMRPTFVNSSRGKPQLVLNDLYRIDYTSDDRVA